LKQRNQNINSTQKSKPKKSKPNKNN